MKSRSGPTRDANEKKLIQVLKIPTKHNVADLLTKSFDVTRFSYLVVNIVCACLVCWTNMRLFERGFCCLRPILLVGMVSAGGHSFLLWFLFTSAGRVTFCWLFPIPTSELVSAASEVSLPDGVKGLVATIDGTAYTVTEASIRSALQLDDLNAIDTITNEEIFAGLGDTGRTKFLMYPRFLQIILDTDTEDTTPYPAPLVTKKIFTNTRHYQGPDMPLLAHMLNQGEPAFVQAQQQEVSPPPPSLVVASRPLPNPMPSPPRQSLPPPIPYGPAPSSGVISTEPILDIPSLSGPSEPMLETISSPIRDDDTGGGSFHESPPGPPPATPPCSPTEGVTEEPLTLTSLLALDTVVLFAKRIKKLKSKLKTKKRKLVLSDLENEEEARQSQELDSLLHLANAALHDPSDSTTPTKPANQEQSSEQEISLTTLDSSSGLDFMDTAIPAARLDSTGGLDSVGGLDSAGGVVSAGGADSASGPTSIGISVAAGPTVSAEPSSPIRDPAKGKAVATPSSPVTALTDKELANQHAAILEAERQELLKQELKQSLDAEQVYLDSLFAQRVAEEQERESRASATQSTQRQAELDRLALNLTNEEWIGLVDQVWANPTLSAELLGADVSVDTFSVRMVELMNQRWKAIAEMKAKAKRDKPMTPAQQKEFMHTFEPTSISAGASIAAGAPILAVTSIPAVTSVPAGSSVPTVTPSDAGVSTTIGASGYASEAYVPIIELLDSPLKDTSLPLDPKRKEQDVPLRKSSRKKSIARRRTLPSPSKSKSATLPFDEDDPEAEFKKYLRKVSDDDEPVELVSLALVSDIRMWEIIPTEFGLGEIHVITRADGTVKRFSTLRELMYCAGRADLMVLYGIVLDKYKVERATCIGLGLWLDLRTLINAREDIDASIIWDDQDQWEIQSWRFYALPAIHVLETEAGDIIYMFMDKTYPLTPEMIQRMLNHGL
nr:aminoacyl-tRNA synthetase, class 1a, anticodon-binding [Tanacetum cinerariifolium]